MAALRNAPVQTENNVLFDNGKTRIILEINPNVRNETIAKIGKERFDERISAMTKGLPLYIDEAAKIGFSAPAGDLRIKLETPESLGKLISHAERRVAFFDENTGIHLNLSFLMYGGEARFEKFERKVFFIITIHELTHWLVSKPGEYSHGWQRGEMSDKEFGEHVKFLNKYSEKAPKIKEEIAEYEKEKDSIDRLKQNLYMQSFLEGTNQVLATDIATKMFVKNNKLGGFRDADDLLYEFNEPYRIEQARTSLLAMAIGKDVLLNAYKEGDFRAVADSFSKKYSITNEEFNKIASEFSTFLQFLCQREGPDVVEGWVSKPEFRGETMFTGAIHDWNRLVKLQNDINMLDASRIKSESKRLKRITSDLYTRGKIIDENKETIERVGLWFAQKAGIPKDEWTLQQTFIGYFETVMILENKFKIGEKVTTPDRSVWFDYSPLKPYEAKIKEIAKEYGLYVL